MIVNLALDIWSSLGLNGNDNVDNADGADGNGTDDDKVDVNNVFDSILLLNDIWWLWWLGHLKLYAQWLIHSMIIIMIILLLELLIILINQNNNNNNNNNQFFPLNKLIN